MFNLVENGEHVSLLGDFNAKSGKLSDYVKPDEELLDIFVKKLKSDESEKMNKS
jgi:hypothetical protein